MIEAAQAPRLSAPPEACSTRKQGVPARVVVVSARTQNGSIQSHRLQASPSQQTLKRARPIRLSRGCSQVVQSFRQRHCEAKSSLGLGDHIGQQVEFGETFLSLALHEMMEDEGVDIRHAREARANFAAEVEKAKLCDWCSDTIDLARACLEVSAEDDALVSHSVVPLPVDAYLARLNDMAAELADHHLPRRPADRSPEAVFEAMDNYIYSYKGFRRASVTARADPQDFYLNGVLTRHKGTPVMLALIYSEIATRLLRWEEIDFRVEMELPLDPFALPQPRAVFLEDTTWWKLPEESEGDDWEGLVLTPKLLLAEVLSSLKRSYWPWRWHRNSSGGSGFLEAAEAATRAGENVGPGTGLVRGAMSFGGTAAEVAAARAASYRLQRGIWTAVGAGDLRRALAASERLLLLGVDVNEVRDYGALLFHCGLFAHSMAYFNAYVSSQASVGVPTLFNPLVAKEQVALQRLIERLRLILAERSWYLTAEDSKPRQSPPEPW